MSNGTTFKVLFSGYRAEIQKEPQIVYARLDFVSGYATLEADGGHVDVPRPRDLRPFVASLHENIDELERKAGEECCEIEVSYGENTLFVQRGADIRQVFKQVLERCRETEKVIRQASRIGKKIKRRPYSEFTDEIAKTGITRLEFHGVGVFENGELSFRLDRREVLMKPTAGGYSILGEST
jgi:hypothetical protein